MAIFTGAGVTISTIIYVLLIISLYMLLVKLNQKSRRQRSKIDDKKINKDLPIGFYLGVANIVILFVALASTKFLL